MRASRFSTVIFYSFLLFAGIVFSNLFLVSCVSVSIGPSKPAQAKNVKLIAPTTPYVPFESDEIDAGWKNGLRGTSISYKSSCGETLDLPLESIQQSMLFGIDNLKIVKSQRIPFNQREALNSVVEGKVDGVDTKMQLIILKKNRCTYMISYVAIFKSYESDLGVFQDFMKSFEAP